MTCSISGRSDHVWIDWSGTWTLVLEGVFCDCISRFITVYLYIIVFPILLRYISFCNSLFHLCIWQAQYPMCICLVWIWWTHNKYNTIQYNTIHCAVKDNIPKILKNSLQEIPAPGYHNFLIIFPFQIAGNIMK